MMYDFVGLTSFLNTITIWWSAAVMLVTIVGGPIAVFQRHKIRGWLVRNRFPEVGDEWSEKEVFQGLVTTVGLRAQSQAWVAQQCHAQQVITISSSDERSLAAADSIERELMGKISTIRKVRIGDDLDPEQSKAAVSRAVGDLFAGGMKKVAVDITGGRVTMSIGAFMAAEEKGVATLNAPVEYMGAKEAVKKGSIRLIVLSRPGSRIFNDRPH